MNNRGIIGYFAHHKVAANLLMLLIIGLGAMLAPRLKNTLTPDVHFPALELVIEWPGAGAEAITRQLIEPVENRLRQLPGVRSTTSVSALGLASINLVLAHDADPAEVKYSVTNAIDSLRNLPVGILPPRIQTAVFDERALRLGLTGSSKAELYQEALEIRKTLFDRGVPRVDIDGWSEPQLEITVSGDRLQALGMSLAQIADQLRAQLTVNIAGNLRRNGDDLVISSRGNRLDENALANLQLGNATGATFRLGEIAQVGWGEGAQQIARVNGRDGIIITLFRSLDTDTLEISAINREWLAGYRAARPDSTVSVLDDASETVVANRGMLISNAIMALFIVYGVMWLAMGTHTALWTTVGIPVILFGTFIVMLITHQSINMFTVAAFIMVLGMIVDDAIVISEDHDTQMRKPGSRGLPSLVAARRMSVPVVASSLTTVVAFVPMLFLPGYFGAMIAPIAIVVISAMLLSLLECFLILPAHLRHGEARALARPGRRIGNQWLEAVRIRYVLPLVERAVAHRGRTVLLAMACVLLSIPGVVLLYNNDEGQMDTDNLRVIAFLEPTTPDSERLLIVDHLEDSLRSTIAGMGDIKPMVRSWSVVEHQTSGRPWLETVVSLSPSTERPLTSSDFLARWGHHLKPNTWVIRYGMETDAEKPSTSISWRLSGQLSLEQLKAATEEFGARLMAEADVLQVEDSFSQGAQQVEFGMKPLGRTLGLDEATIAAQLHAGFEGIRVGQIEYAGSEAEVRVKLPLEERRFDRVARFPVQTARGTSVPLWGVADLRRQASMSNLLRVDGQPVVEVTAYLQPSSMGKRAEIKRRLERDILSGVQQRHKLQRSYSLFDRDRDQVVASLLGSFFIGCAAIYLVMVWSLQSFWWPLLITAMIPLGVAGAVFAHLLCGIPFSVFSMFGVLGMSGVVVNDAIVYMSHYRKLRTEMPVREAVVKAASDRFRAICLTTLTTVLGIVPLLLDPSPNAQIFKPLLVGFGGGLLTGSALLLVVLPALLYLLEDWWATRQPRPAFAPAGASGAEALPQS